MSTLLPRRQRAVEYCSIYRGCEAPTVTQDGSDAQALLKLHAFVQAGELREVALVFNRPSLTAWISSSEQLEILGDGAVLDPDRLCGRMSAANAGCRFFGSR